MVDALVSGASVERRVGSTPILGTTQIELREFSSAGSEHLPYKQRVGGSNPSTPTKPNEAKGVENSTPFCVLYHSVANSFDKGVV